FLLRSMHDPQTLHSFPTRRSSDLASALGYRSMTAGALRELMADRTIGLRVAALMAETRWRMDRHMTAITRLDARERIGLFLLDIDRKSTRLNSSHVEISYAVFCLH